MSLDENSWKQLLAEAAAARGVPGASLAIFLEGETIAVATGVLHKGTGVEATPDSLFQIGSITKVWTSTLIMQLIAEGKLELETPVVELLPDFSVADPVVSKSVTVRHLLNHTSGIDGDLFPDTGRGDDCVSRYVDKLADAVQLHPMGATLSYCNSGFVVLGRIIEVLDDDVWDQSLRRRLVDPLGLTHTVTLPEEALRFRTALGHSGPPGSTVEPVEVWGLPRSVGPAGLVSATASDVITFARLHLDGGRTAAGEIVREDLVTAMQQPTVDVPNRWTVAQQWGLGWFLNEWGGRRVYGHDGGTIGQAAFLRVEPERGLAVALLTNGGGTHGLFEDVFSAVFAEFCQVEVPRFAPPDERLDDIVATPDAVYERNTARITVHNEREAVTALLETTGELAGLEPSYELELRPVGGSLWAGLSGDGSWEPLLFFDVEGTPYVHHHLRATPRIA